MKSLESNSSIAMLFVSYIHTLHRTKHTLHKLLRMWISITLKDLFDFNQRLFKPLFYPWYTIIIATTTQTHSLCYDSNSCHFYISHTFNLFLFFFLLDLIFIWTRPRLGIFPQHYLALISCFKATISQSQFKLRFLSYFPLECNFFRLVEFNFKSTTQVLSYARFTHQLQYWIECFQSTGWLKCISCVFSIFFLFSIHKFK